jgi:hypothetical protein
MARTKRAAHQRWAFRYRLRNGKERVYWLKAIPAWKPAHPILEEGHVAEAIRRDGFGDSQNCPEAVCGQRNEKAFDHPVEGTIDFTYTRAAVVSKIYKEPRRLDRKTKRLVAGECVVYAHDHADIAKLNDTPKGQQKLLEMLKASGPIRQTFRPPPAVSKRKPRSPAKGRRTGTRTRYRRGKARAAFAAAALATPVT